MPFILYQLDNEDNGLKYREDGEVALAGRNGPISEHMDSVCPKGGEWELSEAELLRLLPKHDDIGQSAVLIDLKPKAKRLVELYRLEHIWGFRHEGGEFAPLALKLRQLVCQNHDDPSSFKKSFPVPSEPLPTVYEFLYLGKNWNWGMVGRVNGALLFPRAFKYFMRVLNAEPEP